MAVQTRGFQTSVLPGIQYNDPRSMVANLSGILPAVSQGAGFVSQLSGIAEDARSAPLRRQLQEIQLATAQQRLQQAPLDTRLQEIQLARASQPIERVLGTEVKRLPRINSIYDTPAKDEAGNYTFEEGDTNYDLVPIQRIEVTDPVSGVKSIQERQLTPIATQEQLSDRSDSLEIKRLREESLATQRDTQASLAQARLNNPDWTRIGYGVNPNTGKQGYLLMNKKTREIQEVPSNLIPPPTGLSGIEAALGKLTGGGTPEPPSVAANIASPAPVSATVAATPEVAVVDPETEGLVNQLSNSLQIAAPVQAVAPIAPAPVVFSSIAEAEAAGAAGLIPAGTKITVGGRSATWQ